MRASGARAFVFQYAIAGRTRRMFLGAVKAISIGDARKLASQIYIDVRAGKDPARDKIESQSAAAETFATIVAQYLRAAQQRLRPRSSTEVARHLLKNARPLHPLSAGRLTRRDIAALLVKVAQERGHITSNRLQTAMGGLYTWAIQNGLV